MSFSSASPETLSIRRQLRAAVTGRVVTADNAGYDQARALFYGGSTADRGRSSGPPTPTRSPRSSRWRPGAGWSWPSAAAPTAAPATASATAGSSSTFPSSGGWRSTPPSGSAWAGTGLTSGELTTKARHGLAVGLGDTASVGVGGITLGGGVGYLARKHGLTVDNLLAVELVTADGRTVRTDGDTHPELFWAIRGGGNFGVATRLHFRLHDLDGVVGGMLLLPATVETVAGFMAAAEAAPEELLAIASVMPPLPLPFIPEQAHGRLVVMALICFAGDPEAGERALAPFRASPGCRTTPPPTPTGGGGSSVSGG